LSRKPKINVSKIEELIREGKNTYEIARRLNVTPPTIKYWIKKLKLDYKGQRSWKLAKNPELKRKLFKMIKEGSSPKEIAKSLGVTPKAVKYWINKFNLDLEKAEGESKLQRCPICGKLIHEYNLQLHLRLVHNISG